MWILVTYILCCSLCADSTGSTAQLTIRQLDEDYLVGSYIDHKFGIIFKSSQSLLEISTVRGDLLVYAEQYIAKEGNRHIISSMVMGGKGFISSNGRDSAVPASVISKARQLTSNKERYHFIQSFLTQSSAQLISDFNTTAIEIQKAMYYIQQQPVSVLLIKAIFALSHEVNGYTHPVAMPLFMFALHLDIGLIKKPVTQSSFKDDDDDCFAYCPPCPDEECLGLCGYGCSCWSLVCGDCCYHLGCYDHDVCCRESFFSINCLIPFGFKCEENYYCNSN